MWRPNEDPWLPRVQGSSLPRGRGSELPFSAAAMGGGSFSESSPNPGSRGTSPVPQPELQADLGFCLAPSLERASLWSAADSMPLSPRAEAPPSPSASEEVSHAPAHLPLLDAEDAAKAGGQEQRTWKVEYQQDKGSGGSPGIERPPQFAPAAIFRSVLPDMALPPPLASLPDTEDIIGQEPSTQMAESQHDEGRDHTPSTKALSQFASVAILGPVLPNEALAPPSASLPDAGDIAGQERSTRMAEPQHHEGHDDAPVVEALSHFAPAAILRSDPPDEALAPPSASLPNTGGTAGQEQSTQAMEPQQDERHEDAPSMEVLSHFAPTTVVKSVLSDEALALHPMDINRISFRVVSHANMADSCGVPSPREEFCGKEQHGTSATEANDFAFEETQKDYAKRTMLDDRFEAVDPDPELPHSEHRCIGKDQFKGLGAEPSLGDFAIPSPKNRSRERADNTPMSMPDKDNSEYEFNRMKTDLSSLVSPEEFVKMQSMPEKDNSESKFNRMKTYVSSLVSPEEEVVKTRITNVREDIPRCGSDEAIRKEIQESRKEDTRWSTSQWEHLQFVEGQSVSDAKGFTGDIYSSKAFEKMRKLGAANVSNEMNSSVKCEGVLDWNQPSVVEKNGESEIEHPRYTSDDRKRRGQGIVSVDEFGRIKQDGSDESDIDDPKRISRRRGRSRSRSRSWSPGRRRSVSRSPRTWGSHSRSFSRSPKRRKSHSRTPPQESGWVPYGRGDHQLYERGRRGGRGAGRPACFDFSRRKCFRGSSCRYLHQESIGGPAEFGSRSFYGNRNRGWRENDFQQNWSSRSVTPPAMVAKVEVENTLRKAEQDDSEPQCKHEQGPQNLALKDERCVQKETRTNDKEDHSVNPNSLSSLSPAIRSSLQPPPSLNPPLSVPLSPSAAHLATLQPSISPIQDTNSNRQHISGRSPRTQSPSGIAPFTSNSNVQRAPFVSKRVNTQRSFPMRPPFSLENPQNLQQLHQPFTNPTFRQHRPLFSENSQPFHQSQRPFTGGNQTFRQPALSTGDLFPPRAPFSANQPIYQPSRPNQMGTETKFQQQHIPGPPVQPAPGPSHLMSHPRSFSAHESQFQQCDPMVHTTGTVAPLHRNFNPVPERDFNPFPQRSLNHHHEHGFKSFPQQGFGSANEEGFNHFHQHLFKPPPQENFSLQPEQGSLSDVGHSSIPGASMQPSFSLHSSAAVTSMQSTFPIKPSMHNSIHVASVQPSFPVTSSMISSLPFASPSFSVASSNPSSMTAVSVQPSFPVTSMFISMPVAPVHPSFPVTSTFSSTHVAPVHPSFPVTSMLSSTPVEPMQPPFPVASNLVSMPVASTQPSYPTVASMQSPMLVTSISSSASVTSIQPSFSHAFNGEASSSFPYYQYTNTGRQNGMSDRPSVPMETPKVQNLQQVAMLSRAPDHGSLTTQTFDQSLSSLGSAQANFYNSPLMGVSNVMGLLPVQSNQALGSISSVSQYDHSVNVPGPGLSSGAFTQSLTSLESSFGSQRDNLGGGLVKPVSVHTNVAGIAFENQAVGNPELIIHKAPIAIVENVSPLDDNENWSPGPLVEGATSAGDMEGGQDSKKNREGKGLKLLRAAVTEYVKEVLKPTWREGQMSKEAFKTITKKAVEKVTGNIPINHIPKSQDKVDQYVLSSRSKIAKLVQGYVDKYLKT